MKACETDSNCALGEVCIQNTCTNLCSNTVCKIGAECVVSSGQPLCQCKPTFTGNPSQGCKRIPCRVGGDCSQDEICEDGQCRNICDRCGIGARCSADGGKMDCFCPPGTRGNPLISCATSKIIICSILSAINLMGII